MTIDINFARRWFDLVPPHPEFIGSATFDHFEKCENGSLKAKCNSIGPIKRADHPEFREDAAWHQYYCERLLEHFQSREIIAKARANPNDEVLQAAARGRRMMGWMPRFPDDTCWWGVIDIDAKDHAPEKLDAIISYCSGSGVLVERTRSGGLHLWLLFSHSVPADDARRQLKAAVVNYLCLPEKTEVFPGEKTDAVPPWVFAPDGFLGPDGVPVLPEESLRMALASREYAPEFDADEEKPSIEVLIEQCVPLIDVYGSRNKAGYVLACRLRDWLYTRDEARPAIDLWVEAANKAKADGRYGRDEANASFKQAYKHPPRPRAAASAWDLARPLSRSPGAAKLSADIIPESLRSYVFDVADLKEAPPELVHAVLLTTLAGCVNDAVNIQPLSLQERFMVPMALYGAMVAHPSVKKSPVFDEVKRPLLRRQAKLNEEWRSAKHDWATAVAMHEKDKNAKGPAPEKPPEPIVFVTDTTPEKLLCLLQDNPRGLMILEDEINHLFEDMNRQERKRERGMLKTAWSGSSSDQYRMGRDTVFVRRMVLSLFGGIQPDILYPQLHVLCKDGLFNRLQVLVHVERKKRDRDLVNRAPNREAEKSIAQLFEKLLAIPLTRDSDGRPCGHVMKFNPDATEFFIRFERLNDAKATDDPSLHITNHLGKYDSFFIRVAGLFELCEWASGKPSTGHVSLSSAKLAAKTLAYFESHARKIFSQGDESCPEAVMLAQKIVDREIKSPFTIREVRRRGFPGLTKATTLDKARDVLRSLHWIRLKGRLPHERKDEWEINPDVLDKDFKMFGDGEAAPIDTSWIDSWQPSAEAAYETEQLPPSNWDKTFHGAAAAPTSGQETLPLEQPF